MAKDINLTSKEWCEIVFEGKHQEYGAYQLRQHSPRRHMFAFIGVMIFAIIAFSIPALVSFIQNQMPKDQVTEVTTLSNLKKAEAKVPEENKIKKLEAVPPPELKSSIKFTKPVIKADDEVKEEMKSQEDLNQTKTTISTADVKGNNEETGKLIEDLKDDKVIVHEEPEKVFDVVEVNPSFPGGETALMKYLNENIRYPQADLEQGVQGRVICQFVVGKDGSIEDIKVLKSVSKGLDKEAIRVINSMPKWIPGKQGGVAVKVKYTLPVSFRIQE